MVSHLGLSILKVADWVSDLRYPYIAMCDYRISNIVKPTLIGGENKMYDNEEMGCCGMHHPRMFLTKEERITHLNKYKEWLQNEAKGVDEAIAKLQQA
jgi:hypothetical protein